MSENIIVALITAGLGFLAVYVSNRNSNEKMISEMKTTQAVTDAKIDELTREVREHNEFARRMPVLEEKVDGIDRRLAAVEKKGA